MDQRTCVVIRFEGDRIAEMRDYTDSHLYEGFLTRHRSQLPRFSGSRVSPSSPSRRLGHVPLERCRTIRRARPALRLPGPAGPRPSVAPARCPRSAVRTPASRAGRTWRPCSRCRARSRRSREAPGRAARTRGERLERAAVALVRVLPLEHVEADFARQRAVVRRATKRNRALGSMNRRMSHALAIRSTCTPRRVTHTRPHPGSSARGAALRSSETGTKPRLDPLERLVGHLTRRGAEEVGRGDLSDPPTQASQARVQLRALRSVEPGRRERPEERVRLLRDRPRSRPPAPVRNSTSICASDKPSTNDAWHTEASPPPATISRRIH